MLKIELYSCNTILFPLRLMSGKLAEVQLNYYRNGPSMIHSDSISSTLTECHVQPKFLGRREYLLKRDTSASEIKPNQTSNRIYHTYQSQHSDRSDASSSNHFLSSSSNPAGSVQSTSMIATVYHRLATQHNTTQHTFHQRNQTHLPTNKNRHHNFTPTTRVTGNMPRETQHIRDNHRLALLGRGTAHAPPEANLLAGGAALEWA